MPALTQCDTLSANARNVIIQTVERLADQMHHTSRHLYEHPELSGEEYESSRLLAGLAAANGFEVEFGVAGLPTAFRAIKRGKAPGPKVAMLAEYDALPVVGHGCGHNWIGTASTFAAIALGEAVTDLAGEVQLIGTPAEETDGHKITMLEAGIFDGVAAAMMMHPSLNTEIAYSSLACISVVVEFHGKSAHAAASPWKGINALDAMIQLFVNLGLALKQLPPTAKAPGVIHKGGERANVIPEHTVASFSLRGCDREEAELVLRRLVECGEAAARATGARFEWHQDGNIYFDMRPHDGLASMFREAWLSVGGEQPIHHSVPHGSLDIGNLSHRFPCLHPSIRITADNTIGGHTREFADASISPFAQEQMVRAVQALALTGLGVLTGHPAFAGQRG
jgi:amidohydrolase